MFIMIDETTIPWLIDCSLLLYDHTWSMEMLSEPIGIDKWYASDLHSKMHISYRPCGILDQTSSLKQQKQQQIESTQKTL